MMNAKLFGTVLGAALMILAPASSSWGDGNAYAIANKHRHYQGYIPPRSPYARVAVRGLVDSCWRYRGGRYLERVWTCGNYVKPNAEFDWGYGSSIADQAWTYGYWW
jgi:hypothetical protein